MRKVWFLAVAASCRINVIILHLSIYLPIILFHTVLLPFTSTSAEQTSIMTATGDRDITESRSIVPSSPFEIQATQDLLQKRIENGMSPFLPLPSAREIQLTRVGEITQSDVDLVKQGYRWMSVSATVGPSFLLKLTLNKCSSEYRSEHLLVVLGHI
jgi:hypothetical protein